MTDLARLTAVLEAEITKWSSGLDKAHDQLSEFAKSSTELLQKIGETFGLYFSADAVVEWGKSLLEQDVALDHFSQETGIAVEQLSALEFALQSGGVEASKMSVIFRDLQKNISSAAGDGASNAGVAFRLLGINVENANGSLKDSEQVLKEVADRFSTMQDGANKTALAVELFGKNGEELIPTLNKGADGMAALEAQAAKLGATISTNTAKAAEEFETDLNNLTLAVKEGLGQRILSDLLPVLDSLTKSFNDAGGAANSFDDIAKGVASFVAEIVHEFDAAGTFLKEFGILASGVAKAFTGPLQDIPATLAQTWGDVEDVDNAFIARSTQAFQRFQDEGLNLKTLNTTLLELNAPNLAAAEAAQKAAEAALKQLQSFDNGIKEQVAILGDSGDAAAKYEEKLQSLAKQIAAAGPAGQQLAATIELDIQAFRKLTDDKTITDGLAKIQEGISKLSGNTGDSQVAKLDIEYAKFITTTRQLADAGDEHAKAALAEYDALVKLTAATGDYNADIKQTEQIEKDLGNTLATLKAQFDAGAIGQSDYVQKVADAQTKAAAAISGILPDLQAIAKQTGNPEQLAGVDALKTKITGLSDAAGKAGQDLKKALGDDATSALLEFEKGTASAGKAFSDFLGGVEDELLKLANQKLIDTLFGSLISGTGGGSGAGIFGTLAGLFSGGKAEGGDVVAGNAYRINENTPNSEYFVPKTAGTVIPASGMGGGLQVHQYFSIQAPTGSVSRQTQSQIGASASKQLAIAAHRNN